MTTNKTLCACSATPCDFYTCDGPYSGVPDDQRRPHAEDVLHAGLVSDRAAPQRPSRKLAEEIAHNWDSYGFTAADLTAWVELGVKEPAVAAACRTVGFDPHQETDRRFLLLGWAEDLDNSEVSAEAAFAAYKGAP